MKFICILIGYWGINGFSGCHYFLHQFRIPVVLDVVIGSSLEMGGNNRPSASNGLVKRENDVVFFFSEATMLYVRTEVVEPAKAAAFAASFKACFLRQGDPVAAGAMALDVASKGGVFLRRPGTALHVSFVAARSSSHHKKLIQ